MNVSIISQSELPDTYEEWMEEYKNTIIKNSVQLGSRIATFNTEETRKYYESMALEWIETIEKMKSHYGVNQPGINYVEIICNVQL